VTERILIDTDTASDDAVALIMALRAKNAQVVAISTVAGNVPVQQATRNALYVTDLCGVNVPVYQGAEKPLARRLLTADWFHGKDGLGDHDYPAPTRSPEKQHAVDAIVSTVRNNPGLTLVTLGPLTNIALALAQAPDLVRNVSRCVIMGGAPCCEGNVTPAAEYNIWVDPEAARIVFLSGLHIEMIGWQLSRFEAVVRRSDIEEIQALDTKFAEFAIHCNSTAAAAYERQTGEAGISLPDPIAMAVLLDPALSLSSTKHFVEIETVSELTRGMTVVDRLSVSGDDRNRGTWKAAVSTAMPAEICWKLDVAGWKSALMYALR